MIRFTRHYANFEDTLLIVVFLISVGLSVTQIISRNLLDSAFLWIDPINRILVLWIALLGAMLAARRGEHICIDLMGHILSQPQQDILKRLCHAITCVICCVCAYYSVIYIRHEIAIADRGVLQIPSWCLQLIIPWAFIVMGYRYAVLSFLPDTVERRVYDAD